MKGRKPRPDPFSLRSIAGGLDEQPELGPQKKRRATTLRPIGELSAEEKKHFNRIRKMLPEGYDRVTDASLVTALAGEIAIYERARLESQRPGFSDTVETGHGPRINPVLTIMQQRTDTIRKLCAELGLSATSVTRIEASRRGKRAKDPAAQDAADANDVQQAPGA